MKILNELKQAAARKLPDKLKVTGNIVWITDSDYLCLLRETEWLHIAHLLEGMMSKNQWDNYEQNLYEVIICDNQFSNKHVNSTYQQRLTAMREIGFI